MAMHNKGLTKLMEECGEAVTVAAKFVAYPDGGHPDGAGALTTRLEEEIADVLASCEFVISRHELDFGRIFARKQRKIALYVEWEKET